MPFSICSVQLRNPYAVCANRGYRIIKKSTRTENSSKLRNVLKISSLNTHISILSLKLRTMQAKYADDS